MDLRKRQLLVLEVLRAIAFAILLILLPLAYWLTVGWSMRLIAIGLAFEMAGAWTVLVRSLVDDYGQERWAFSLIYRPEAENKTKLMPFIGLGLLLLGFALQFVSVVIVT